MGSAVGFIFIAKLPVVKTQAKSAMIPSLSTSFPNSSPHVIEVVRQCQRGSLRSRLLVIGF
jgi:hypothetical protein